MKIKKNFLYTLILFLTFFLISKNELFFNQSDLKQTLYNEGSIKCALFTTSYDITQMIVDLINNEKKSIKCAMYIITDLRIALALIKAKERGVQIEIITDNQGHSNKFSKIPLLKKHGINIYVDGTINSKEFTQALMHNKFTLFEQNIDDKSLIASGSFNFTKNAQAKNKENILILDDKYIYNSYKNEFNILKDIAKNICNKKPSKQKKSFKNTTNLDNGQSVLKSASKFIKSIRIKI